MSESTKCQKGLECSCKLIEPISHLTNRQVLSSTQALKSDFKEQGAKGRIF